MVFQFPHGGSGGQQCPPAPPSSPADSRRRGRGDDGHPSSQFHQQQQHQQQRNNIHHPLAQQQIANLLQFAQTSYTTNPTDALSALMDALTLSTGTNTAALHAMDRIRSELGHVVADCVVTGSTRSHSTQSTMEHSSSAHHQQEEKDDQLYQPHASPLPSQLSTIEMTERAMAIVQEMLNDTSTILYAQGRQHILQQAMEDGSSIVCSNCGDMISRERWKQHAEYWCRGIVVAEEQHEEDEDEEIGSMEL